MISSVSKLKFRFFYILGFLLSIFFLFKEFDLKKGNHVLLSCGPALLEQSCNALALSPLAESLSFLPLGALGAGLFFSILVLSYTKSLLKISKIASILVLTFIFAFIFMQITIQIFSKSRGWGPSLLHSFKVSDFDHAVKFAPSNTIQFFFDYKCPFCRKAYHSLQDAISQEHRELKIEFHYYPAEDRCNKGAAQVGHEGACLAARIALCAENRTDRESILNFLIESPNRILENDDETFRDIEEAGPKFKGIKACAQSEEIKNRLADDIKLAKVLSISATPTFIFKESRFSGAPTFSEWIELFHVIK